MITGTFNGASILSLPFPVSSFASVEFSMTDAVSIVSSPFTGQTQTQQWFGADAWSGTITLPVLAQGEADQWISFLMKLRGQANCFFLSDPLKPTPRGFVKGAPVADSSISTNNLAGQQQLVTRGWTPGNFSLLLPGDYLQIGNRLHRVLDQVNSDGNGGAIVDIWPSLREAVTDATVVILSNPAGLFRLASNKRTWSADYTGLTRLSFPIQEFR